MALFGVSNFDSGESFNSTIGEFMYMGSATWPGGTVTKFEAYCSNSAGSSTGQYNNADFAIYQGGTVAGAPSGATLQWNSKYYGTNVSFGGAGAFGWYSILAAGDALPNVLVPAGWIWVVLRANDGIQMNKSLTANQGDWDLTLDTQRYNGTNDLPNQTWPSTFAGNGSTYTDAMSIRLTYTAAAGSSVPIIMNSIRQRVT